MNGETINKHMAGGHVGAGHMVGGTGGINKHMTGGGGGSADLPFMQQFMSTIGLSSSPYKMQQQPLSAPSIPSISAPPPPPLPLPPQMPLSEVKQEILDLEEMTGELQSQLQNPYKTPTFDANFMGLNYNLPPASSDFVQPALNPLGWFGPQQYNPALTCQRPVKKRYTDRNSIIKKRLLQRAKREALKRDPVAYQVALEKNRERTRLRRLIEKLGDPVKYKHMLQLQRERRKLEREKLKQDPRAYEAAKAKNRQAAQNRRILIRSDPSRYEAMKAKQREANRLKRLRIKQDPVAYEAMKEKHRESVRRRRLRMKNNQLMRSVEQGGDLGMEAEDLRGTKTLNRVKMKEEEVFVDGLETYPDTSSEGSTTPTSWSSGYNPNFDFTSLTKYEQELTERKEVASAEYSAAGYFNPFLHRAFY